MEANPNSETVSTNESPDISTSQQESLTSDGQYGYDDANSTSSIHDEAVSSAIMEISGELMLGKFTTHHPGSGDSESSDISDYDGRRPPSGGAIAKYPESSTGLSDNDWNPYATESDTNQTPRSPRSVASDERVGFVSKATFNIAQPKDTTATVIMTTGEVNVKESNPERIVSSDKETKSYDDGRRNGKNGGDRLDILRYVMDDDDIDGPDSNKLAPEGRNMRKDVRSPEDDVRRDSPDTARSGFTEDGRSVRQSADSGQSLDTVRRESTEFDQASRSQTLGSTFGRPSSEFDMDEYRRESAESARSFQGEGSGIRSGRQSTESGKSGRSSKSDLDRSGESGMSGRQSADSHNSGQSGRSAGSQKSTGRSAESDRSTRLDRLSNSAGENLKELMQFESAQRALMNSAKNKNTDQESKDEVRSQREDSGVSRTRLTARLEPYNIPVRSSKSPERSSNVGSSGYISVAERERLLTDSPDASQQVGKSYEQKQEQQSGQWSADHDRPRPEHAGINLPKFGGSLQDSETSMKRVSSLFEETKRQAREAVALRRPDPSGSEERFPLRERLTWPKHDESFKAHDRLDQLEKGVRGLEKSRDSEAARSLNSEEVARVLGKYATDDTDYPRRKDNAVNDRQENEYGSAFDRIAESGQRPRKSNGYLENSDNIRVGEMSDDDISKRVKALLTETSHLGVLRDQGGERKRTEYIPRTIDYSRLQQDLQEIQDSLQDVPPPAANDSIHVQRRNLREGLNRDEMAREEARSLESTGTTTGRESGVSEYGRRLLWDHGADLEYDQGYRGQFMGTRTSTETLSSRLRASGETDTLVVRPDSAMTNDTEYDAPELEGTRSLAGSKTLTGSDIARAEKLVEQVMNRRPEGDLKESVEDIIARYRNERKDMFDRLQAPAKPQVRQAEPDVEIKMEREKKVLKPILKDPDVVLADKNNKPGQQNGRKEPGLAERVFKILTSEQDKKNDSETSEDKGMAKKVYKILASDRPRDQVNGILSETMEKEHEMLKKLITRPKEDSSMEDSGVNETVESFEEQDVKKQLEWSKYSSPGKGDKSEFTALREVTSAPYSALSNAKSLLSTQLKKMSERNFDKSVELRTPYRQAITCYPVYGAERTRQEDQEPSVREAWMPVRRSAMSIRDRALASERFYLTEKDTGSQHVEGPQLRGRTYSDPFDVSFSKRTADYRGEGHTRSRSEEAGAVSDLSQHSFSELECSPERMTAGSPRSKIPGSLSTPKKHRPQDYRGDGSPSPTESDTSGSRKGNRLRPYRPAGSRDMYYTESGDDTNESGTTIESTHPGSDDAAPPYIPSQFLGSRRDEPVIHSKGIYGNREKDDLSTIDENSVKDDKEKALSASVGSGKEGTVSDRRSIVTTDTGYQTGTVRSRSPASLKDDLQLHNKGQTTGITERPGFKTREEFQRDFEKRERELKELLSKHRKQEMQRDSLGTSTRSDPGGMLEDQDTRWEYRQSDQMNEFRALEPEPAYPEERLRYSRSRSDTDLVALSPTESQKYSSPVQPGRRFLEFSTQQSPIFAHHDSITHQSRGVAGGVPPELPRVPAEREMRERVIPPPKELPKVYDRKPVLSAKDLPSSTERRKSPIDEPVRPLEPGEPPVRPLEPGSRSPVQRELDELPVRPLEPGSRTRGQRLDEVYVKPLEPGEPPLRPLETGSRGQRSDDILGPVDLGADPRKMGAMRRTPTEMLASRERTKSPLNIRQKEMEAELEKLNKQLSEQVNEITGKKDDEHFEDHFPPSKKVQALREVLEQEYNDNLPPNINDMWARFKERKEQSMSESSLNSTRLDALSGLLQNPTHHDVHSFIKEKKEISEKQKKEEDVKAEILREEQRKLREEQMRERELEKKIAMEKAALERNLRRQELKNLRGLSEEESNGSYTEILLENEKKREQRRKKGERDAERKEKKEERSKSPAKKAKTTTKSGKDKERRKRTKEEATVTDIKARNMSSRHSDTADTLFSIPEDASFEQSPSKAESEMKSRQKRHRHVIDPLMKKLRDKIKMQRDKIDKERRKELQRVEKLKKLEMLLNAKKKGKLSDRAIGVELEDVSTTMSHSESSQVSDSTLTGISTATRESDSSTQDSTTLKDSTMGSTIKLQVKMYPDENYRSPEKHYVESDSTETSDFSNIIVERLPEKKSERRSKDKKSGSSAKKYKVDAYGNKIRKEKKEKKKQVFGVEVTEKDLANQLKRFETYMTPEKERMLRIQNYLTPEKRHIVRDAATMYPSPITVSPPSKRRTREVVMKSEAIQTTPSIRSSSPTHSYDEVPVAPVPYMSRKGRSSKTSRRRPSPSPTRSAQTSFSASPPRKSSSSPTSRKKSRSPGARVSSKSPTSPRRRFSPPITRRQAQSPIWKPESEIFTPPENSMFTPEGDENLAPTSHKMKEAESWFVSMKPSKPWRQPLKERQAFAVRQEAWKPKSIPQSDWKQMMSGDIFKDKGDPNDISRDTKFDLDPEGQPLGDVSGSESEDDLDSRSKPLSKMSLQEAFQVRKGEVISRLRERQKRLNLAAEQRKMEAYLKMERDQLFQEERKKEANPDAHPYSAHLHRPVRRVISKEEMKEMTQKKYKKLPEVIERQKLKKRQDEYSLNRIKARLFNRKIQKKVLVKAEKWGR